MSTEGACTPAPLWQLPPARNNRSIRLFGLRANDYGPRERRQPANTQVSIMEAGVADRTYAYPPVLLTCEVNGLAQRTAAAAAVVCMLDSKVRVPVDPKGYVFDVVPVSYLLRIVVELFSEGTASSTRIILVSVGPLEHRPVLPRTAQVEPFQRFVVTVTNLGPEML